MTNTITNKWETYAGQTLQPGDIVEMSSRVPSNNRLFANMIVTFVKHYGIAVNVNNEIMIAHNPYGKQPEIVSQSTIFNGRQPDRIMHTQITNNEILNRFAQCQNNAYKFFQFNCEDFVRSICACQIGVDQRVSYFGTTAVVIFIAIVATATYLIVRKK